MFVNSTPVNSRGDIPARRPSHTSTTGRSPDPPESQIAANVSVDAADFQMISQVVGILDALCWRNRLAAVDQTTRGARTNLLHNDPLATVVQ